MKALSVAVAKIFPGASYWASLPGFVAFCGMAVGVCAARYCATALFVADGMSVAAPNIPVYVRLFPVITVVFAAAGILCRRSICRAAFFAVCGAALFFGSELRLRDFYGGMETAGEHNRILSLTLRISSPPARARSGFRFRAKVIGSDNPEIARLLARKTLMCVSRAPVPPYGVVTVQGRYAAPRRAAGPLGFDQREHFAVNNIYGNFTVSRVLSVDGAPSPESVPLIKSLSPDLISYAMRTRVHGVINKASSPGARGIFHAALLGEKEHLPADVSVLFRRSGIVHLLAISGFHAALLYSAVFAALGILAIPPKTRIALALAALWAYLFFIGFIPSLFRATVMVSFFCLSMMLQRKNHPVHSLGIAGLLWLFLSPHSLFAPGFQLSFAATAGIVMMLPVLDMLTRSAEARTRGAALKYIVGKTITPFWVSVASFAATAPPLLYHFGTLSLYGIFFNIIAIPLMSVAMWLFFIAIVVSPVGLISGAAVWCSEKILDALTYLAGFSEHLALSEIVVSRTTGLQLFVMTAFMAGLCGVRKNLRAVYALRAGGAASLVIAAVALKMVMNVKTETLTFTRNTAVVDVILRKDNTAWIAAQGRAFDVRPLREREIEPLLARKKIRSVPLIVINEEAEEEAHAFMFTTGYDPCVAVIRKEKPDSGGKFSDGGYERMDVSRFVSMDGTCSMTIEEDGRIEVSPRRRSK